MSLFTRALLWGTLGAAFLGGAHTALAQDCSACHAAPTDAPPAGPNVHAMLRCTECHVDLGPNPHRRLEVPEAHNGDLRAAARGSCARCHETEVRQYERSAHAAAVRKGSDRAPRCDRCHGDAHVIAPREKGPAARWRIVELCASCHANEELAREIGLPAAVVETYESSMHGKRAQLGRVDVPICTDCHGVHAVVSPNDPSSPLQAERRAEFCGTCHPGSGKRFAQSFEHVAMTRDGFPLGYWVKWCFAWLVLLTTGALALHVFLDLQSHIRGTFMRRREQNAIRKD